MTKGGHEGACDEMQEAAKDGAVDEEGSAAEAVHKGEDAACGNEEDLSSFMRVRNLGVNTHCGLLGEREK